MLHQIYFLRNEHAINQSINQSIDNNNNNNINKQFKNSEKKKLKPVRCARIFQQKKTNNAKKKNIQVEQTNTIGLL